MKPLSKKSNSIKQYPKYSFLSNSKKTFIGTAFLLGNLTLTLQAKPINAIYKNNPGHIDYTANENVRYFLQKQGLNPSVALEKATQVFSANEINATVRMHNLLSHCKEDVSIDALYRAVAKRALLNKKVNLASYATLVSLVQDVKGVGLDNEELTMLQKVASVNSLVTDSYKPVFE